MYILFSMLRVATRRLCTLSTKTRRIQRIGPRIIPRAAPGRIKYLLLGTPLAMPMLGGLETVSPRKVRQFVPPEIQVHSVSDVKEGIIMRWYVVYLLYQ